MPGRYLRIPRLKWRNPKAERPKGDRRRSVAAAGEEDFDRELFEKLRQVRLGLAQARGIPAYMILHDSVLREMARTRPSSEEELAD